MNGFPILPCRMIGDAVPAVQHRHRSWWLNVDLEKKHETHVRMGEREIHVGVTLDPPSGSHDPSAATSVMVEPSELQRPRDRAQETNPVPKVDGAFVVRLRYEAAAGLGRLLAGLD